MNRFKEFIKTVWDVITEKPNCTHCKRYLPMEKLKKVWVNVDYEASYYHYVCGECLHNGRACDKCLHGGLDLDD